MKKNKKEIKTFIIANFSHMPRSIPWERIRKEWGLSAKEVREIEDEIQKELRQKRGARNPHKFNWKRIKGSSGLIEDDLYVELGADYSHPVLSDYFRIYRGSKGAYHLTGRGVPYGPTKNLFDWGVFRGEELTPILEGFSATPRKASLDARKAFEKWANNEGASGREKNPHKPSPIILGDGTVSIDHRQYPKWVAELSEAKLRYIIEDAQKAIRSLPTGEKAGYYADEINYAANEISYRRHKFPDPKMGEKVKRPTNWGRREVRKNPFLQSVMMANPPGRGDQSREAASGTETCAKCMSVLRKGEAIHREGARFGFPPQAPVCCRCLGHTLCTPWTGRHREWEVDKMNPQSGSGRQYYGGDGLGEERLDLLERIRTLEREINSLWGASSYPLQDYEDAKRYVAEATVKELKLKKLQERSHEIRLDRRQLNPKSGPADEHLAYDLYITMTSDPRYSQHLDHIKKNLVNKMAGGTFDLNKATKLLMYVVDIGAARYTEEFGSRFNKNTRLLTARSFAEEIKGEAELGNYDYLLQKKYQKNPCHKPSKSTTYHSGLNKAKSSSYNAKVLQDALGLRSEFGLDEVGEFINSESRRYSSDENGNITHIDGLKVVDRPGYEDTPAFKLEMSKAQFLGRFDSNPPSANRELREFLIEKGDGYYNYGMASYEVKGLKYRQVFAPGYPVHPWRNLVKGKGREKKEYLIEEGDGYHHYGGGSFEVEGSKYRQVFAPGYPVHRWRSLSNPLDTAQRRKLPASEFGLPKSRRYPMEDRGHAISAKAYAKQELDRGNLSKKDFTKIVTKADKVLREKSKKNPAGKWELYRKIKGGEEYRHTRSKNVKFRIFRRGSGYSWAIKRGGKVAASGIASSKTGAISAAKRAFTKRTLRKKYKKTGRLIYNNPPSVTKPPFREGQKVSVAEARAWIKSTGDKKLMADFDKARKLQSTANRPPKEIEWRVLDIGSKGKLDSVTAMVKYGTTDSTFYKPLKGSHKGTHFYEHEWGEGSGKAKPIPMYVSADGKTIVNTLGKGQKAGDWLRG